MRPTKSEMLLIASLVLGLATVVTIWDSWQDIKDCENLDGFSGDREAHTGDALECVERYDGQRDASRPYTAAALVAIIVMFAASIYTEQAGGRFKDW